MPDFGVSLNGSDRKVILRFAEFPVAAHDRLLAALRNIEARLEAAVLASLPADKSGNLRSMVGGRVYDHGNRIAAVVGVRVKDAASPAQAARKALTLEFGNRGNAITMKAHRMRLDHVWANAITPKMVDVGSYSRTPTIAAMNFLRGPAAAIRPQAIAEMQAAVAAAQKDVAAS